MFHSWVLQHFVHITWSTYIIFGVSSQLFRILHTLFNPCLDTLNSLFVFSTYPWKKWPFSSFLFFLQMLSTLQGSEPHPFPDCNNDTEWCWSLDVNRFCVCVCVCVCVCENSDGAIDWKRHGFWHGFEESRIKISSLCSSRISTWNAITFGQIFRQFICSLIWINPIDCITTWIRRANFFPSVFLTVFLFLNPIWPGGGYINPPQIFFRDKLVCNACRSCRTVLWVFSLLHRAYFETKFVRSRHAVTKCTIIQDVQKLALLIIDL